MPGISGIAQVAIPVTDIKEAKEFYCNKLKLDYLFEAEQMCFVASGEVRLMLSLPDPPEMTNHSNVIYFETEDIEASAREMKQNGVHFLQDPQCIGTLPGQELWMAFFRDPFSNILALEERKVTEQ